MLYDSVKRIFQESIKTPFVFMVIDLVLLPLVTILERCSIEKDCIEYQEEISIKSRKSSVISYVSQRRCNIGHKTIMIIFVV